MRAIALGLVTFLLAVPPLPARQVAHRSHLPHNLTPAERKVIARYLDEAVRRVRAHHTERAVDIAMAPGEFQPSDGAIFAWVEYTDLLEQLIKEVAQDRKAYVALAAGDEDGARQELTRFGVKMENVVFVHADLDSVWMRDYGPNFAYTRSAARDVVDLVYNRPRPNDDKFPTVFAQANGFDVIASPLILPGGNLILDGHGVAIMTDVVFDASEGGNPDMTMEQLQAYMKEAFGVQRVIMLKHMNADGTGHADMFCKLLNEETFIVGQYATPGDGADGNAKILDDDADQLAHETNGLGHPFHVFRIPMPRYTGTSYTYTNSLIVDDKVLVPTYGFESDQKALDVYRTLMPGARVVGFDCNSIIGANGAIHCITQLMMSAPLTVSVAPPATAPAGQPIAIEAHIAHVQPLDPAKVQVLFRTGTSGDFQVAPLTVLSDADGTYGATLPPQPAGTLLQFYVSAEDASGIRETAPLDAPAHAYSVQVGAAWATASLATRPRPVVPGAGLQAAATKPGSGRATTMTLPSGSE